MNVNEMAMGMGIHGELGVWSGPVKTADELAAGSLDALLKDMPVYSGEEVALLINGLGATSVEELYILSNSVSQILENKGISIYRTFVGEFATSMEIAGVSISMMKVDQETKEIDMLLTRALLLLFKTLVEKQELTFYIINISYVVWLSNDTADRHLRAAKNCL